MTSDADEGSVEEIVITDELISLLDDDSREFLENLAQRGQTFIDDHSSELDWVRRHMLNLVSVHSAQRQFERMQGRRFEATMEWVLENDASIAALVITYARLFNEGRDATRYRRVWLPEELLGAHDEIIALRNQRYAHHGDHDSMNMRIHITMGEESVSLLPQFEMGFYVNGAQSWRVLFDWWANKGMTLISERLRVLSGETGVTWRLEDGPNVSTNDRRLK